MAPKRVLMVAYHYPPCRGSSGLQRTLSFTRYLPALQWEPIVLSATPRAYATTGTDQLGDIPPSVIVRRAFALDTARDVSFCGRYPGWLAIPDQWISWSLWAVPIGLRLIRRYKPAAIWSTYPIATAHLIGYVLHRLTGLPWIVDFRDPMTEVDPVSHKRFPADPRLFRARARIERIAVTRCTRAVLVTRGALKIYQSRYPEVPADRWALIPNGYDEDVFASIAQVDPEGRRHRQRVTLLHSGVLYPTPDRDPRQFFRAIAQLKKDGSVSAETFRVILRASGSEGLYRESILALGIEDVVALEPAIPYRAALSEMMNVDGLLLFQGRDSNPAVPAKLYEYIRAKRPILALVDTDGDTAAILRESGIGSIAPLDSEEAITSVLRTFLDQIKNGTAPVAGDDCVKRHSREWGAKMLAGLLDEIARRQ
ncbi:glycosyltransferase [Nitrospira moscoviensis]|uniref:Uncharacterized protein n=1 Tax=Nitrospira moscoviensis TaxID=42253 RepID=A0A0K2GFN5_NITMO|nr:glycosyltransferase [Nitrospira moscoviensis]ALA59775.1 hypothetical protein NITMOv2_3383 [Nitrospira moscoviensis]